MLTYAYKVFAKTMAPRLVNHLYKWIKKEQKGFIRGRYILDAIITLWEGLEYAKKTSQRLHGFQDRF